MSRVPSSERANLRERLRRERTLDWICDLEDEVETMRQTARDIAKDYSDQVDNLRIQLQTEGHLVDRLSKFYFAIRRAVDEHNAGGYVVPDDEDKVVGVNSGTPFNEDSDTITAIPNILDAIAKDMGRRIRANVGSGFVGASLIAEALEQ